MHGDILELLWKDFFPGNFDYATLNLENVHHFSNSLTQHQDLAVRNFGVKLILDEVLSSILRRHQIDEMLENVGLSFEDEWSECVLFYRKKCILDLRN